MSQARVDAIVKRLRELPSLPTVLLEVNRVMNSPAVTVDEVRDIISRDPSITSKILRMANSSYYGLSYRVDTLGKAITVLGFNTIRNLAVTASVYDIFESLFKNEKIEIVTKNGLSKYIGPKILNDVMYV